MRIGGEKCLNGRWKKKGIDDERAEKMRKDAYCLLKLDSYALEILRWWSVDYVIFPNQRFEFSHKIALTLDR
mgnify:CR=1 FL=1